MLRIVSKYFENGNLLASSPYQKMHFVIDLKGIAVNGVELLIIFVTLIVNKTVNQMVIIYQFRCWKFFKILDWSSHTAKVYLNGINALFCYETGKLLASSTYQQMHFLTIDLKGNGVELLITFVTLIVNKKVIPCLCPRSAGQYTL